MDYTDFVWKYAMEKLMHLVNTLDMKTKIELQHMQFEVDSEAVSIFRYPLILIGATNAGCPSPTFRPVMNEYFTGQVTAGGPFTLFNIGFNPHVHCTHTECVGHISSHHESIDRRIRSYHCLSQLISVSPTQIIQMIPGLIAIRFKCIELRSTYRSFNYSNLSQF